jgi:RNA recognition motif-containing protein
MNIFVGNLNKKTTAKHLFQLFLQFGRVISARIIMDNQTGHSLGCGYIEMDNHAGTAAIQDLNNRFFMNSFMEVNEVTIAW